MNICTISVKNYLAHARVLAESFREHHPDGVCTVLILDDPRRTIEVAETEPFEILHAEDIGIPGLHQTAVRYAPTEFSNAVKPWLLKYLLERGASHIVYLDPDIQIFAGLEEVGELAEQNGIVLVPRITEPVPLDDEKPTEREIVSDGIYDPGFLALGRGEVSARFLDWWTEGSLCDPRTGEHKTVLLDQMWTLIRQARPRFADRRWIDLVPNTFPDTKVLRDPGYGVAYWNLHSRKLERTESAVTVNGRRLRFFHFSGFQPDQPYWLSKHATRVRLSENAALADLCRSYAMLLFSHKYEKVASLPYEYAQLPNGISYDSRLRELYADAVDSGEDFGNIFEPEGAEAFLTWLNAPSEHGGQHGVTRFLHDAIYARRKDLQQRFRSLNGPPGKKFVQWLIDRGIQLHSIPSQLVPFEVEGTSESSVSTAEIDGVNVVGFLTQVSGLGEVARKNVAALQSAGIPIATKTITLGQRYEHEFAELDSPEGYSTNLVCLQPFELLSFHKELERDFFRDRRSVGVWGWELDTFPEEFLDALDLVDEVWVWTSYVAKSLSRVSPKPIVVVPPPVLTPDPGDAAVDIGVPEGFTLLYLFDFHSIAQRKNPLGLVEAFKRAFTPGEGPQLLIKSMNGHRLPQLLEQLKVAALDRSDIYIVDQFLSQQEKAALMVNSDCYVSLHRSEGFGLSPAEAMALGKPVIATGFSGNTDFMTNANSYLVNYSMTKVGPGIPPYPADGTWAEPDLDHAAHLMREVWENPDEARMRGARAKKDIEKDFSLETVGEIMRSRFQHLAEAGTARKPAPEKPQADPSKGPGGQVSKPKAAGNAPKQGPVSRTPSKTPDANSGTLPTVVDIFKRGPAAGASSRLGRAGVFARRMALRSIRPFTHYQRQLDSAIIGALQEVAQKVKTINMDAARLRARLERAEAGTGAHGRSERQPDVPETKLSGANASSEIGPVPSLETSYLGHPFIYPYDSLIGKVIADGQEWDSVLNKLVAGLLPDKEPTICEVGSNIGASLLQIMAAKPQARLLAFEPSTRFLPFLEGNLEAAGFKDNVEIFPLLLGRESGDTWLYNNSSSASVVSADYDGHQPRGKQHIEMTTLDEVLRDRGPVDFVKTDTDGFDFEVLRGAEATLRRDRPILYFELAPHLASDPVAELLWLQSLGYRRFVCVRPQGALPVEVVLINGITRDPEQAIAWANEDGLCDVLTCPEGSPAEARLEHIEFITRTAED